jgi:hypothetical protein
MGQRFRLSLNKQHKNAGLQGASGKPCHWLHLVRFVDALFVADIIALIIRFPMLGPNASVARVQRSLTSSKLVGAVDPPHIFFCTYTSCIGRLEFPSAPARRAMFATKDHCSFSNNHPVFLHSCEKLPGHDTSL